MTHQHNIKYEFEEGRFPGWRGDQWCINCNYVIYSRESIRMQMFGLIRNVNPPQRSEEFGPSTDKAMFKMVDIKI